MKMKVLTLRPTQMALGMKEVDYRVKKLAKMKDREREEYLLERLVPVVIGKDDCAYIVDHHHLVRSCWEVGIDEVHVDKIADLSNLSLKDLWQRMKESHWIYPYDQMGNGPHDPVHLPENIKGLADDPFRSIAWAVREKGGFTKTSTPFSEFKWANFFREKLKLHPVLDIFDNSLKEAIELAESAACKHLPGYVIKK
jgi:hypothetical protein